MRAIRSGSRATQPLPEDGRTTFSDIRRMSHSVRTPASRAFRTEAVPAYQHWEDGLLASRDFRHTSQKPSSLSYFCAKSRETSNWSKRNQGRDGNDFNWSSYRNCWTKHIRGLADRAINRVAF